MENSKKNKSDFKWYAVNVFTGHENKVSIVVKQRAETANLSKYIKDIVIPTQNKTIIADGKKRQIKDNR